MSDEIERGLPQNMRGFLRFLLEQTKNEDSTQHSDFAPLDEDRRKWLQEALSSMTVNVAEVMLKAIEILKIPPKTDEQVQEYETAFEELISWVENMDFANDFHKLGGFDIFPVCFEDPNAIIREKSMELLAVLVQNNPYCQNAANEAQLIHTVMKTLDKDPNNNVCAKAVFALSALTRDNPVAQKQFVDADGFSILLRTLQKNDMKIKRKASFMLYGLCSEKPEFQESLCNMGFVEQLVGLIQQEHDETHEHLLASLHSLICNYKPAINECRRSELNLKETLMDRIKELDDDDAYLEEVDYCKQILKMVFSGSNIPEDNIAR